MALYFKLGTRSGHTSKLNENADNLLGLEEIEGEDDFREEYACPFCSDYFDIVSLCCHVGQDPHMDTINGVCPVCAVKVSSDMVAHITLQHSNMNVEKKLLSAEDHREKLKQSEFVQGVFSSMILVDDL
ncbi:hypothetical protein YC2023_105302 [Brassica napus]